MSGPTSDKHDQYIVKQTEVLIMLLSPEEFIPAEVAMRTTMAKHAFRAQPRRAVRRRRARFNRRHTLAA